MKSTCFWNAREVGRHTPVNVAAQIVKQMSVRFGMSSKCLCVPLK